MKAIRLSDKNGTWGLVYEEMTEPRPPRSGEILVRLKASSLNNHDLGIFTGRTETSPGRIPLSDGAGIVHEVGEGVTDFKVGDRVVSTFFPQWQRGAPRVANFSQTPGDGVDGYAREFVTLPSSWFTRAPENLNFLESATMTTAGVTAWRALMSNGDLKSGQTVLVQGTGGVSIYALQIAKAFGARVVATSSSDFKLDQMRKLGAEFTINYKDFPDWGKRVQDITDGRGVDHVVEIGGSNTMKQSIEAVCIGGHIALIGVLTGHQTDFSFLQIMLKQIRAQGCLVGSHQDQVDLVSAIESKNIKPPIDKVFALSDLAEAFRFQESRGRFGKIAIEI